MRVGLRVAVAVVASVVLGAHFLRAGHTAVAVGVALGPLALLARRRWAVRLVQGALGSGVAVWLHTLILLVAARRAEGAPWMRMALILGFVAAVTALAAAMLEPLAASSDARHGSRKQA